MEVKSNLSSKQTSLLGTAQETEAQDSRIPEQGQACGSQVCGWNSGHYLCIAGPRICPQQKWILLSTALVLKKAVERKEAFPFLGAFPRFSPHLPKPCTETNHLLSEVIKDSLWVTVWVN